MAVSENQVEPWHAPGSPLESCLLLLRAAAKTEASVFLRGESGTGKEVLSRFLHRHSARAAGPWVAINCAAIAPSLLEAELFGAVKGAFTGALAHRPGKIRQAHGGTLFLDEIGDMPLEAQTRLLRVLQERRVAPVGGDEEIPVDFRLVCATHRDLRREIERGTFREDLFYRLHVLPISVPALRERPGDLPGLMRHFLSLWLNEDAVTKALATLPGSLASYPFPGNVRELRNLAERYSVHTGLGQGWPEAMAGLEPDPVSHVSEKGATKEPQRGQVPGLGLACPSSRLGDESILQALKQCGWHRARAAQILGISKRTLQYRLARWNREPGLLYI